MFGSYGSWVKGHNLLTVCLEEGSGFDVQALQRPAAHCPGKS